MCVLFIYLFISRVYFIDIVGWRPRLLVEAIPTSWRPFELGWSTPGPLVFFKRTSPNEAVRLLWAPTGGAR